MEFKETLSKLFGEDYDDLPYVVRQIIDKDLFDKAERVLNDNAECESPIEQIFVTKLNFCKDDLEGELNDELYLEDKFYFNNSTIKFGRVLVQRKIDNYRVDIVLPINIYCNGNKIIKNVIIECDGYEHHYSTPEKILKDKEREKYLERKGYSVIRFLGKQIVNDIEDCIADLGSFCYKLITQEILKEIVK